MAYCEADKLAAIFNSLPTSKLLTPQEYNIILRYIRPCGGTLNSDLVVIIVYHICMYL